MARIREKRKTMDMENAVRQAVEECIRMGVLKEFLLKNKAEVFAMSIYEYDEEAHMRAIREEGKADGIAIGMARGREKGRAEGDHDRISLMLKKGKTPEAIVDFCGYTLEEVLAVQKELENSAEK